MIRISFGHLPAQLPHALQLTLLWPSRMISISSLLVEAVKMGVMDNQLELPSQQKDMKSDAALPSPILDGQNELTAETTMSLI